MRWDRLKNIIITTAESELGFQQPKQRNNRLHDSEIEKLSIECRNLRSQQHNITNPAEVQRLKNLRNQKSHQIRQRIKQKHEKRLNQVIDDIGR